MAYVGWEGDQVGDDDLLVGNDDEEDVCRHDGGGKCAQMQEGGAAGEHLRVAPGHGDQHDIEKGHQAPRVFAQR
jgi:hypothetical protein